ncbi:hypothetical protein Leryth_002677 [Lithospermum erythrorhizon]|nr:hypothetical protein Leryth_002677 [Lithospermum erythrorhizon]
MRVNIIILAAVPALQWGGVRAAMAGGLRGDRVAFHYNFRVASLLTYDLLLLNLHMKARVDLETDC